MEILIAFAIGVLAYLVVKWLLNKSEKLRPDAEFLGAAAGIIAFLWQLGVIR